jgi:hypothetical protein
MIVSDAEIRHALELTRPLPRPAAGRAHPMAPDPDARLTRLEGLRKRLRAGTYEVEPGTVAEKMIGRAIVDQIAHLLDGADDTGN